MIKWDGSDCTLFLHHDDCHCRPMLENEEQLAGIPCVPLHTWVVPRAHPTSYHPHQLAITRWSLRINFKIVDNFIKLLITICHKSAWNLLKWENEVLLFRVHFFLTTYSIFEAFLIYFIQPGSFPRSFHSPPAIWGHACWEFSFCNSSPGFTHSLWKTQLIDGEFGHRSLLLEVMEYRRIYGLDFFPSSSRITS